MTARPATSATRVSRHTHAVTRQRRASHPAVTSLAPSIATAIPTTASGAPGNNTTMPLIEKNAAAPARTIAATYAAKSIAAPLRVTPVTGTRGVTAGRLALRFLRNRRWRSAAVASLTLGRNAVTLVSISAIVVSHHG